MCVCVCVCVYVRACVCICVCFCVSSITGNKTLLSYSGTWDELIHHYTQCRYVVGEHWAEEALKQVKQTARKQPPLPPSKREGPVQKVQDGKLIAQRFSEIIEAHNKLVKEGLRKKPQMLQ